MDGAICIGGAAFDASLRMFFHISDSVLHHRWIGNREKNEITSRNRNLLSGEYGIVLFVRIRVRIRWDLSGGRNDYAAGRRQSFRQSHGDLGCPALRLRDHGNLGMYILLYDFE